MTVSTPTSTTRIITLRNGLNITINEYGTPGDGTGALVLHGGAGPRSVAAFAATLSQHAYVVVPTHPGFDGTPRPDSTDTVADLATAYLDVIEALGLHSVMVIGSSIGGWIATEMGLLDNRGRLSALVLLGSVGIKPDHPLEIVDTEAISPAEFFRLAFHNPDLRPDPGALSDEQWEVIAANQRTVAVYAGKPYMHDPKLRGRLHRVTLPVLVIWGEQDGIVPPAYGHALARSFPRVVFRSIPQAGHFPHLEQPGQVLGALGDFVDTEVKGN